MLDQRSWGRALRLLSLVGFAAALLFFARPASAYPWMIRHQYQGCGPCHADPSGGGLLTDYGRAMGENVLRMRYGKPPPDEPPAVSRFLFGVPTPEWLLLGGSVRNGYMFAKQVTQTPAGGSAWDHRFLQMQADLRAQMTFGRFRASGALGYMWKGAKTANITSHVARDPATGQPTDTPEHNLSSREHWLGVDLGADKQFLLRAGRINVPFGIRNHEHELFTRSSQVTRTNINESQQHGIAFAWTTESVRGEVMALLGNYQLNPDEYRERGYAGFVEFKVKDKVALGASSMLTYAKADYLDAAHSPNTIRHVHGAFVRASPVEQLVIMAETDALFKTTGKTATVDAGTVGGFVGTLQFDIEPIQGLHFIATGEALVQRGVVTTAAPTGTTVKSFAGWASVMWFFAPHCDLRFDFVTYSLQDGPVNVYMLPQIHVYL